MCKLLKGIDWLDVIQAVLKPSTSRPLSIYGLPKIDKENCPLHPIVNTSGAPAYELAKYLASLLKHFQGKSAYNIFNFSVCGILGHIAAFLQMTCWLLLKWFP